MSEFTDRVERNLEGCEAFSVGACEECDSCHEFPGEEEGHFFWAECDSCTSRLGGDRHAAHWIYEGSLIHCEVCSDCLVYHANGEEPEQEPTR